ncbi:MAG TPA: hypothetical protein VGX28_12545 [Frankiaceae bacterium]|jgi:hypothetical protein|nr:hypothetical protein [Frankiaceae bacterium]
MKRTLTLSREHLAALTGDELSDVVGAAAAAITVDGKTCPLIGGCINVSMPPRCE